jgi:DNA ligase-1
MMRKKAMLAQNVGDYSRIKDGDWPLYVQPKLDGVRCLIQRNKTNNRDYPNGYQVTAYSRTGKEWKNIDHILSDLVPFFDKHPNVILDGELYNHDLKNDFEKIISLVRKTKPTDEDRVESAKMVQFHCYDIINEDWTFEDRNLFINEHFSYYGKQNCNSVLDVDTRMVHNTEEVEAKHEEFLELGYEGSILRQNKPYECKRSYTLMKVKDFYDTEATITGWVEGKGKRIGTIGKFMAIDADGNEFGMPVMDKFAYLQSNFEEMKTWVGKIATFTYFERTKANSYRHPLFKCIRNYE